MTIDKAIKHCEEIAQVMLTRARCCNDDSESCRKCADEHRQLAEWLKELKAYRDMWDKVMGEIENLTYYWCEVNPKSVIDDVLQIIEKYKKEIEG